MSKWRYKKNSKKFTYRKRNMKLLDIVPDSIVIDILTHIEEQTQKSEKNYPCNQGDEVAITGSLFSALKTDWINCGNWSWNIDHKISNRRAEGMFNEKETGADGIISINIKCNDEKTYTKSILFQAKKEGNFKGLDKQIKDMNNTLKGGNMVIIYSDRGFWAQTANEFDRKNEIKFDNYMRDVFFACQSGFWGRKTYISGNQQIRLYCLNVNIEEKSKMR